MVLFILKAVMEYDTIILKQTMGDDCYAEPVLLIIAFVFIGVPIILIFMNFVLLVYESKFKKKL